MSAELSTTPVPLAGVAQTRLPRVNLLPPEIAERRALRRIQAGMAALLVAAVALTGGYDYLAHQQLDQASQQEAAAANTTAQLQHQVSSLSGVTALYSEVSAAKAMLASADQYDIIWANYLTDLSLELPDSVWLTSLTFTESVPTATSSTATATPGSTEVLPGATGGLGTLTMSGDALSRNDVASMLAALSREKGFAAAYASSVTESTVGSSVVYPWSVTVVITSKALANRLAALLGS